MALLTLLSMFALAAVLLPCGLAIRCYLREGTYSTGNGAVITCAGYQYCYSYSTKIVLVEYYAGCTSSDTICSVSWAPDCKICSSDYCNTITLPSISCNSQDASYIYEDRVVCRPGITTCFSHSTGTIGCGGCQDVGQYNGYTCITCNTNYCNTRTPSSISCYSRYGMLIHVTASDGGQRQCPTGMNSCFSYINIDATAHVVAQADCGTCDPDNNPSCVTCSTSYCNSMFPNNIACYNRQQETIGSTNFNGNGTLTPCSTGVTTCYSYITDINNPTRTSFAGCGVCKPDARRYGCTTCNSVGCNAFAIPAATSKILVQASASTIATDTRAPARETTSTTKATMRATAASKPLSCYSSSGTVWYLSQTIRSTVSCSGSLCYTYSYGSVYYAGCGQCPAGGIFSDCRTCSTDNCNSASAAGVSAILTAAAALLLMEQTRMPF